MAFSALYSSDFFKKKMVIHPHFQREILLSTYLKLRVWSYNHWSPRQQGCSVQREQNSPSSLDIVFSVREPSHLKGNHLHRAHTHCPPPQMGNVLVWKVKCADGRRAELLSAEPAAGNAIKPLCSPSSGEPALQGQLRPLGGDFTPGTEAQPKLEGKKAPQGSCHSLTQTSSYQMPEKKFCSHIFSCSLITRKACANISCEDLGKQIQSKPAAVNRYQ